MQLFLITVSLNSFADANILNLTKKQCSTIKISLKDAESTIGEISSKTGINIQNAVRYSLVQNQSGVSLHADKIDATWINTDMSYLQLVNAANTCKMPVKSISKLTSPRKNLNLQQCHSIEYFYNGVIETSIQTNAASYLNSPMEVRNERYYRAMDSAVMIMLLEINKTKEQYQYIRNPQSGDMIDLMYLASFGKVTNPDSVIKFKKLQAIYGECLNKFSTN